MGKPAFSAFRALASDKRVAMLRALQERDEPMDVAALATVVDLHVNTVREHLDRLVASGLVTSAPEVRTTRGRPRLLYSAVERVAAEVDAWTRDRLLRLLVAGYGVAVDSPADAAQEAGRGWGRSLVRRDDEAAGGEAADSEAADGTAVDTNLQVATLVLCLDDLGFAPELDGERLEITMRRCPFRDVSRDRPEVVCGVHLGIVQGVLAERGGPVTVHEIENRLTSAPCVLRLVQA